MNIGLLDVTCTVSFGGVQTAVWELARALHDQGHQVTVYGGKGEQQPELDGRAISIKTFAFTPRQRFPNLGTRFRKLAERLSFAGHARNTVVEANHDWIVLTKPFDFFWPRLMPADSRTRFAFMSGGTDFMPGDRFLARGVSAWVACSHFNAWQIGSRYKCHPRVMFNGVDVARFNPDRRDEELRAELGVARDDVLFAFAGRIVGWKGLQVAIRALAHPLLRECTAKLLLVGAGPAVEDLRRLAAALGVTNRVQFLPPQSHTELPRYYASADAGLFPSLGDEAFGITIAEAMACGIPVVASHNGGIPEVVGNEGTSGLLFEIGNVEQCAGAMASLCASRERRRDMGKAARQRIVAQFTWAMAARRLVGVLEAAASRS